MRSNKIDHVDQKLISALSSEARSSVMSIHESPSDSNKLGVFFSPIDAQNEEILKFFGDFNFGDLIGDPSSTYDSSYKQFEKFRQIYYDQGFGIVDYQSFMNVVRAYFDKAMFKYIGSLVPARAKYVNGILVEPSILERPKIQLKPVVRENIDQKIGLIDSKETISANKVGQLSQTIAIGNRGTAILNDVNQRFYEDGPKFGFGVYASDGIFVDGNDFYRVDIVKVKKSYQVRRSVVLPQSQINYYENYTNLGGSVQTISRSYYELNLISLPVVSEYPFTASWGASSPGPAPNPSTWYFSGSISVPLTIVGTGYINSTISSSHTLVGITTGSLWGFAPGTNTTTLGTIVEPMTISASFVPISSSVLFSGYYDNTGGNYTFDGLIIMNSPPSPYSIYDSSQYRTTVYASSPTSSIFQELLLKTSQANGAALFTKTNEVAYRKAKSLLVVPENRQQLNGYFPTHYKYKKQVFSQKEINSFENIYNQNGVSSSQPTKWRRGSQSKKTTVDNLTGNLNGSDPVERKSA